MADWSYGVNDAATVKLYSHRLFAQAIQATTIWKLAGMSATKDSPDNICQLLDETQKTEGDVVKYDLIAKLQGRGVVGDNTLAGNEESLKTYQDSMGINQLRHAVLPFGAMSQQRVPFSMRDMSKMRLSDWWAERLDLCLINQLCGNTTGLFGADASYAYTGHNAPILPDADHCVFGGDADREHASVGLTTGSSALGSNDTFTIDLLDTLVAKAHTMSTPIKPLRLKGLEVFGCLFLHPLQVKSLRSNFTTGQWGDIQKAALSGGQITGNPLFTGAIGMYSNIVIHEDVRIPYGTDAGALAADGVTYMYNPLGIASVARGVFVGAQACCMAFGRAYGTDTRIKWFEELLDGGNQLRISAGMIFGLKKTRFNSADYATISVSTYETM